MRLDALAVGAVFILCMVLMIHQYHISQYLMISHKTQCWLRAEEVLNKLLKGESFAEYVEVRLYSRNGVIQYSYNVLDYEPQAVAYTYRILENSTLIYCKVYCRS